MRHFMLALVTLALTLPGLMLPAAASQTTITYQGQLQDSSGPVTGMPDMTFRLYDSLTDTNQIGADIELTGVPVTDGLFRVELDFGAVYDQPMWLAIEVDGTVLSPRQSITPAPLAVQALNVPDDTLGQLDCSEGEVAKWSGSQWGCALDEDTNYSAGAGLTLAGTTFSLDADHTDGLYWRRGGNAGTNPATDFIGTTDETPLEVHVDGKRVLRLEPAQELMPDETTRFAPNWIAGAPVNQVADDVHGATIAGGGREDTPNTVSGHYGTVGGGRRNTASERFATVGGGLINTASGWYATVDGGWSNTASEWAATVGGGSQNTANNTQATVGGGRGNTASGWSATVGGGEHNTASALEATVGGGRNNIASGLRATVPGGENNTASGTYSLAAGRRAKAEHNGAFVWADHTDADFASTRSQQFLVRAGGGVGYVVGDGGWRIEPADIPNVIGGWTGNSVASGVIGATIGGGGCPDLGWLPCYDVEYLNQVTSNFGTIAGGLGNIASSRATVGGGWSNTASNTSATVAGGQGNEASGSRATVGGGWTNTASNTSATVAGGHVNQASGERATVGGGFFNFASGTFATVGGGGQARATGAYSTVPGGWDNRASGDYSFSAGHRAKALHDGAFVWADDTDADFASTGIRQFLIRAGGGVGINTNAPEYALDVDGMVRGATLISDGQGRFGTSVFVGSLGGTDGSQEVCRVSSTGRLAPCSSSSLRYKQDVENFELDGEWLQAVRPVSYRFIESGRADIGLIAEELAEIDERLVVFDDQGRPDSIRYGRLTVLLIAAMQEREARFQSQLDQRDEKINRLQAELTDLAAEQSRVILLEQRLAALEALLLEGSELAEVGKRDQQ